MLGTDSTTTFVPNNASQRREEVSISDDIEIEIDRRIYLDDILFPHFPACYIFDYGDRTVERLKTEKIIKAHAFPGSDMVDNNSVSY